MAQSGHSQPSAARAAAIKNRIEAIRASAFSSPSCKEEELGDGVARFSGGIDQLFVELWRDLVGQDEDIAVVATGGWGRSEVGPYSDLDFVLLSERPQGEVAPLAERLLYPLWDAGLSVGHSVGSPREVARLAKNDVATATAMLDARWIVGDQRLADELRRRTSAAIAPGGNANQFVADLVEQMQHRHRRFGASLYLLEPHLKQGIGALRDLDTIGWVARARYGAYDLADLVDMGQLSARQVHIAKSARRFLLELRSLLQMSVGRRTDQLTFEVQERIAPVVVGEVERAEGDIRPAVAPAVEALMQRYYLHARGVLTVAERFLEAARIPKRKKPRLARVDASFLLFNGQLAVKDAKVFDDRPSEMVRTFRKAAELDVPIYGHTKDLIEERMAGGPVLQGDPVASRLLLDALCDLRDERQPSLLEQMHQVGLLSELMPEFGPCTCRVQHDLYHVYTVDQHQLKAVAMLKRHLRGQEQDIAGKVRLAVAEVKRPEVLALGMLLHDVGKPLGKGHSEKGAQLARVIGGRLGMRRDDLEVVEFLVRQHLTMSHLSQRRDLSDPDVIQRFAGIVESEERLAYLYLLTRCDAAMTAPGNLTSWKDQLLGELYDKTRSHLHGTFSEAELSVQDQAELARQRAVERVRRRAADESKEAAEAQSAEMRAFVDSLDDRFVLQMSSGQLLRVFRTARKREATGRPMALYVAHFPLKKHSEVVVVAEDSPGLLADVTG
ncbi:MAG: HD domain-containing protein, partial [Deltaproteobacteria bacterium]|nr:HD domain-containing protein [Deltaproteobacteria bacterium]